jgi:hypothetical protein
MNKLHSRSIDKFVAVEMLDGPAIGARISHLAGYIRTYQLDDIAQKRFHDFCITGIDKGHDFYVKGDSNGCKC